MFDDEEEQQNGISQPEQEHQKKKRPHFVPCKKNHPDARHHSGKKWIPVTPAYVIAFLAVLIFRGAKKPELLPTFGKNMVRESHGFATA